jgi:hypothetical protein
VLSSAIKSLEAQNRLLDSVYEKYVIAARDSSSRIHC